MAGMMVSLRSEIKIAWHTDLYNKPNNMTLTFEDWRFL